MKLGFVGVDSRRDGQSKLIVGNDFFQKLINLGTICMNFFTGS